MVYIEDALGSTVAWPIDKIIMSISNVREEHDTISSPTSEDTSLKDKCKLLDWCGSREVVAEGRWFLTDPKKLIHHTPLGPNAISVWVDKTKKLEAFLWRPSSEMNCIEEANGSIVAWPANKVIMP